MKWMTAFKAVVVAVCMSFLASADAQGTYHRIVSWNTRHAGWNNERDWTGYANEIWRRFGSNSNSTNGCDIVFLQEVMYADSGSNIAAELTRISGVTWGHRTTAAIGRTSYKERYSVLFRTDRVSILNHYVWNDTQDRFERQPQVVKVRCRNSGADYTYINWHTIFGTTAQRQQEIHDIRIVFNQVQNSDSSDRDVILLGDHNRDATSPWWNNLKALSPTVSFRVNDLTSINSSCNFANRYDHFWFQATYLQEFSNAGRKYIAHMCNFYKLSDHAAIWMRLYATRDDD